MKFFAVKYDVIGDRQISTRIVIAESSDEAIGIVVDELTNADLRYSIRSVVRVRESNTTAILGKGLSLIECLSLEDREKLNS
jgi:hypothetical protein